MVRLLSQTEIAQRSGHSPSAVHYIVNGDREPSKKMSYDLMRATGVAAGAWMYPEFFYNPYIPIEDAPIDGRLWMPPIRNMMAWLALRCKYMEEFQKSWDLGDWAGLIP